MMQRFTIETPSGRRLTIEAPDEATALRGAQEWHSQQTASAPMSAPVPKPRPSEAMMAGRDVAGGVGSGLVRGVAGLLGAPADIHNLASQGMGFLVDQTIGRAANRFETGSWDAPNRARAGLDPVGYGSADITRSIEDNVTGPLYQPQTMAGQYAETIARNAPMAAVGPGGVGAKAALTAIPGVAEESAGQLTRGTAIEPYARAGAGIAAGIGTAMAMRPNYADRALGRQVGSLDDAQAAAARQLMENAQREGVNLTAAEAIQSATRGGSNLGVVQRRIEQTAGGQEIMAPFMAQRGGQVERAMQSAFGDIAPPVTAPSAVAGQAREAAESALNQQRQAINAQTAPLYRAAESARVSPADFAALQAHPSFASALRSVRADPELRAFVGQLPDDSVVVIDKVKQLLVDEAQRVGGPMSQTAFGNARASVMGDAATMARQAGVSASPEYAQALQQQAALRQSQLVPMEQGPLGRMIAASDPRATVQALVPPNPLPGAAQETSRAAQALARQNPDAARAAARLALEDRFNSARNLGGRVTSQADQFTGAEYARRLRGEAGEVADAAVRATAGDPAADRMRRLVEVLLATGERLPAGSPTAFNQLANEAAQRGGVSGLLSQAGRPVAAIREAVAQARLERGSQELARVLTSGPDSVDAILRTANRVKSADRDALARILLSFGAAAEPASRAQQGR